jgi:hypothetical protein
VREEFSVTRQVVNVVREEMKQAFAAQQQAFVDQKTYIDQKFATSNQQFSQFLHSAANVFNGGANSGGNSGMRFGVLAPNYDATMTTVTTTNSAQPPSDGGARGAPEDEVGNHYRNLQWNYSSLLSMWDEWHGKGPYQNQPIPGGFAALEKEQRSKWRKHFTKPQEQDFSRIRRLVDTTIQYAQSVGKDEKEILSNWDVQFQQCGKSIRKLVNLFQTDAYNLIQKRKPRGKNP